MKRILTILTFFICLFCLNCQELSAQSNYTSNEQSVRIFKAGAFNLDQDRLIRNCERNVSSWAQYYVKSKNRDEFYKGYGILINAINEGRVSRNYDRSLNDNKGLLHNNKGKGYDDLAQAVTFVNTIIDDMIKNDYYLK